MESTPLHAKSKKEDTSALQLPDWRVTAAVNKITIKESFQKNYQAAGLKTNQMKVHLLLIFPINTIKFLVVVMVVFCCFFFFSPFLLFFFFSFFTRKVCEDSAKIVTTRSLAETSGIRI